MATRGRSAQRMLVVLALIAAALFVVATGAAGQTQAQGEDESTSEQPVPISAERPDATADHSKFEILQQDFATGPDLTAACLSCHTEAAKQLQATTHWTWDTHFGDGIGKTTQINNFCIGVQSN
ncbi:MAG: hypothetical protein ABFS21_04910, partial [Actinomycetota bacterium]